MLSIFATNKPERRKRLQGVKSAWASLGQFWTSGAPEKYKRLVFMSQVLGTAVSGLAAFAIEPVDTKSLDALLGKYLKVMLMGRATWNSDRGVSSFSHEKLRFYWRIPKVATELRVHRVKWFQTMVDNPLHHKQ
eukprot:12900490-Heterocapsa_arctica.AAC.1